MRPELKARLWEGASLWLVLALVALAQLPARLGLPLPVLERTALWHLEQSPGVSALLAGFSALMLLALWFLPPGARAARLALAGVLFTAGLASGLLFAPSLLFTYVFSARLVAQPFLGARVEHRGVVPGADSISLGWVLVPAGLVLLVAWVASRIALGAQWVRSPGSLALLLSALVLFASAALAVWRFSRRAPHR